MMASIILFCVGVFVGSIGMYCYDYWRNLSEFNKRQERYKKMI